MISPKWLILPFIHFFFLSMFLTLCVVFPPLITYVIYLPLFENTDNNFLVKNVVCEALKVKLKSLSCLIKQQHGDLWSSGV